MPNPLIDRVIGQVNWQAKQNILARQKAERSVVPLKTAKVAPAVIVAPKDPDSDPDEPWNLFD